MLFLSVPLRFDYLSFNDAAVFLSTYYLDDPLTTLLAVEPGSPPASAFFAAAMYLRANFLSVVFNPRITTRNSGNGPLTVLIRTDHAAANQIIVIRLLHLTRTYLTISRTTGHLFPRGGCTTTDPYDDMTDLDEDSSDSYSDYSSNDYEAPMLRMQVPTTVVTPAGSDSF